MEFYPRSSLSKQKGTDLDINSDVSFATRQRELRSLLNEFRGAIDTMKTEDENVSQMQQDYYTRTTEMDEESTYDAYEAELKGILDEIRMLIAEVIGIKAELRSSSYQNHMELFKKLDDVIQILTTQRQRAETLLIY